MWHGYDGYGIGGAGLQSQFSDKQPAQRMAVPRRQTDGTPCFKGILTAHLKWKTDRGGITRQCLPLKLDNAPAFCRVTY